jgi:hypothetical protein
MLPDRLGKAAVRELPVEGSPGKLLYGVRMNAKCDLARFTRPKWDYDWAKVCGRWAWTEEELEAMQRAHSADIPEYVMDLVRRMRDWVLKHRPEYKDAVLPQGDQIALHCIC